MQRTLHFIFWILLGTIFLNSTNVFCQGNETTAILNQTEYNPSPFTGDIIPANLSSPFIYNPNPFTGDIISINYPKNITWNPNPFTGDIIPINVPVIGEYLFYVNFTKITPVNNTTFICQIDIPFTVTVANPKIIHDVFVKVGNRKYYLNKIYEGETTYHYLNGIPFNISVATYQGNATIYGKGNVTVEVCVNTTECVAEPCWHICKPVKLNMQNPDFLDLQVEDVPIGVTGKLDIILSPCRPYPYVIIEISSNCTFDLMLHKLQANALVGEKSAVVLRLKPNEVQKIKYFFRVTRGNKYCEFKAVAYTREERYVDKEIVKLLSNEPTIYVEGTPRVWVSEYLTILPIITAILMIMIL